MYRGAVITGSGDRLCLVLNLPPTLHSYPFQTYTANILTVVNPYKDMPGLYTQATATSYKGTSLGKLAPHTYAIGKLSLSRYRKTVVLQGSIYCKDEGLNLPQCNPNVNLNISSLQLIKRTGT